MSGSQRREERERADRVLLHIKEVSSWNGCQGTHTASLSDFRCALNSCHTLRKNRELSIQFSLSGRYWQVRLEHLVEKGQL